ncbi:MAG TPA: hypothetical protein GXZ48_03645 [Acholeplasmataceae bacterium]|nr:hypothetical protein [Acholeplasmataceae bacterium]
MKKYFLVFILLLVFLLAGCKPKQVFTVQFLDYDDSVLKTEEVEYGNDANAPETPEREGYTFVGWSKSFTNVMSDVTVKALYKINKYTVNFYDHDGSLLKTEEVEYGKNATPPEEPERVGYNFTGWNKEFENVKEDLEITAQYSHITFEVSFYTHDLKLIDKQTVNYGEDAEPPVPPVREGYTFDCWTTDFTNVTTDLYVYPKYIINKYTVEYKDHEGKVIHTEIVEHGETAPTPKDPTRNGYKFTGWDQDLNNITSDLVVYAQYEIVWYEIIFVDNLPTKTVDWKSKEEFIDEFYTDFYNWLDSKVYVIEGLTKSDDTYKLTRNGVTITWTNVSDLYTIDKYDYEKTLGNIIYKPLTRTENVKIEVDNNYFLNTEPYRSKYIALDNYFLNVIENEYPAYNNGYGHASDGRVQIFFRFQQWIQGTNIQSFNTLPTKNVPDLPDGVSLTLPSPVKFTINDRIKINGPTHKGLTFLGWYDNPYGAGNSISLINEGTYNNITLYAIIDLDPENHHIIFIDNGKIISTQDIKDGETLDIPDPSPNNGYEFIGWDKDVNKIESDITFTAVYEPIVYTIKYNANIDSEVNLPTEPLTYTIENEIILPKVNAEGYIFVGWYDNPEGDGEPIMKTSYGNLELYARWIDPNTAGDGEITLVAHEVEIELGRSSRVYTKLDDKYLAPNQVIFLSENPEIVTVDETGFVLGKKLGTASIIAVKGQDTAVIEIKIVEKEYEVKWVGHQGSGGPVVQNTVSAFEEGGKRGYYAMECDVRVSADGVYYICHDDVFQAYLFVDESLIGKLMAGYTWDQLKTFQVKDTYQNKTYYGYLSTVEEYLKICKKYGAKPVLELKWTTGINNNDQSKLKGLVELTQEIGVYEDAIFLSSMKNCLSYIREHFPDANVQFLSGSTTTTEENIDWCIENRFSIDAAHTKVTKELVEKMHNAGLYVNAYTVNDKSVAQNLQELGVDMITTDNLGVD